MTIVRYLWLIPALPILAAGIIAFLRQPQRKLSSALAIGAVALSFLLSLAAFTTSLHTADKLIVNVPWFQFGDQWLQLGWLLDPLTAVMLVMVTLIALLVFVFSVGYMEHDENATRFFCFLALFAGAMLGVLIANNLLLLFMCWEVVGLTSYLLIGFWYRNPAAAAAAKKAFLVTRIGDLGLLLGMVWLYAQTGTLTFYDGGTGCLEAAALTTLVTHTTIFGLTVSAAIGILIFCGAAGKSGQFPLHVWLPDAMEGPTPVSALIHAATMVAAGVFLIARVYPLLAIQPNGINTPSIALQVVTWIGAITALLGSLIAIAQFDIKRILAYSTIAQLGYMMIGLGVGGPAVGIFHLITHAFFKALLFLGAASVIHGTSGEQDIRYMGGLRKFMPITFATYTIGMLALCGFPLFSGFWSKDEILVNAFQWGPSRLPFYIGAFSALLTAFYMTRQFAYVFAGALRRPTDDPSDHHHDPHESRRTMTVPLMVLAAFALLLGFAGTPAWPWFQGFLEGEAIHFSLGAFNGEHILALMAVSVSLVFLGLGLGWLIYLRKPILHPHPDPLEAAQPVLFRILQRALFFDAIYNVLFVRPTHILGKLLDVIDRFVIGGLVHLVSWIVLGLAWFDRGIDTGIINGGFNAGCAVTSRSGRLLQLLQTGRVQAYLCAIGAAFFLLTWLLLRGMHA